MLEEIAHQVSMASWSGNITMEVDYDGSTSMTLVNVTRDGKTFVTWWAGYEPVGRAHYHHPEVGLVLSAKDAPEVLREWLQGE